MDVWTIYTDTVRVTPVFLLKISESTHYRVKPFRVLAWDV